MPKFMGSADGQVVAWCPTLHLLCVLMYRMLLWVYRPSGERIYSINNRLPIRQVRFLPDGLRFAVLGDDGKVKVYDLNTGALVRESAAALAIESLDWNACDAAGTPNKFADLVDVDLLKELPLAGVELHPKSLDYVVVTTAAGAEYTFNGLLQASFTSSEPLARHVASSDIFKQYFVSKGNSLIEMQTSLDDENRTHFKKVVTQVCRALALVDHINTTFEGLKADVDPFFAALDRYMGLLTDEAGSVVQYCSAYVFTGLVDKKLKDFWLNQMGERGWKILHKTGTHCYDLLRRILFGQIIALLERLAIVVQNLQGLALWLEDSASPVQFGLSSEQLQTLLDATTRLLKETYQFIWALTAEQKLFDVWLEWIKNEFIDRLAKDDEPRQTPLAKSNYDVLKYVSEGMLSSVVLSRYPTGPYNSFKPTNVNPLDYHVLEPTELVSGFQSFFGEMFAAREPTSLSVTNPSVVLCDNRVYCASLESLLAIEVVDVTTHQIVGQVTLTGDIRAFELTPTTVVVLTPTGACVVPLAKLEGSQTVGLADVTTQSLPVPLANPQRITVDDNLGCVLDANRQNYEVITIV